MAFLALILQKVSLSWENCGLQFEQEVMKVKNIIHSCILFCWLNKNLNKPWVMFLLELFLYLNCSFNLRLYQSTRSWDLWVTKLCSVYKMLGCILGACCSMNTLNEVLWCNHQSVMIRMITFKYRKFFFYLNRVICDTCKAYR